MSRALCLAVALGLALGVLASAQDALDVGRDAYARGRFADALPAFASALAAADAPRAAILCAMGNCAYQLGRHAEAIRHYRSALLRAPHDVATRAHLRQAQERLGMDGDVPGPLGNLGKGDLLALTVALQTLGLCGAVVARRRPGPRRALGALGVLGLVAGLRLAWLTFVPLPIEAVIVRPEVEVRDSPGDSGLVVGRLRAGEIVRVAADDGSWVRIEHAATSGWTPALGIGVIE